MTAVTPQPVLEQLDLDPSVSDEPPGIELLETANEDDDNPRRRHKKRSKEERRKRSLSYSTDASMCSNISKRRKKKKKHHRRSLDEPPSPKVNPIFLWVKEDNAKIVEVRCEDYDRRNRIKLTKTAGGWRATPHVQITQWLSSSPTVKRFKVEEDDLRAPKLEPESLSEPDNNLDDCIADRPIKLDSDRSESKCETPPPQLEKCPSESDLRLIDDSGHAGERTAPKLEPNVDISHIRKESDVLEMELSDSEKRNDDASQLSQEKASDESHHSDIPLVEDNELHRVTDNIEELSRGTYDDDVPKEPATEPALEPSEDPVALVSSTEDESIAVQGDRVVDSKMDSEDNQQNEALITDDEPGSSHVNSPKGSPSDGVDENANIPALVQVQSPDVRPAGVGNADENSLPTPHDCETAAAVDDSISHESMSAGDESLPEENSHLSEGGEENKQDCVVKCCEDPQSSNVDENHNNEFDSDSRPNCMNIEPSNFCQDVEEILGAIESQPHHKDEGTAQQSSSQNSSKDVDEYDHNALMTELEEMMNERMKNDHSSHKDVLDIYTFVPSPSNAVQEKAKPKETRCSKIERVIEQVKAKSACAMLAKATVSNQDQPKSVSTPQSQLRSCELDNLDLLWRLPEGTTIHHSKLLENKDHVTALMQQSSIPEEACPTATISLVKPATPVASIPTYSIPPEPIQEEPLNLGKPRRPSPPAVTVPSRPPSISLMKKEAPTTCKQESKPQFAMHHSQHPEPDLSRVKTMPKGTERCTPDSSKPLEPLAQLKEIMSDPEVTVPDPLLVPKERLSALIANPKREIPRLMALTNEVKYPKLDTNLMEVSLAHLQLLLQSSKKEDELKLIQKHADLLQSHLKNDSAALDPATMNALNQMLWFPYLSHLDMSRTANPQDVMGMMNMMYPYNAWGHQAYDYAQQSHLMNFWQDIAQKPNLSAAPAVSKGYSDLYKSIPPVMSPSLYTSASSLDNSRVMPSASYPSRTSKHSSSRRHHRPETAMPPPPPLIPASATDFLKSPAFDLSAWSMPQTSEASRVSSSLGHYKFPPRSEAPALPSSCSQTKVSTSETPPKLKVRKFEVDPNAVPKLINKNLAPPSLPPLSAMSRQVPSHYYDANHLWNPLYA
ncbi:Hypothetical protein NTJ_08598 [Nesidiocoris tenuis]|uniref:Uncharacterized protein n=1 Tax=Nesidiocoris tenuis TaxID=355587 RepID=A0ABN7AWW7_9HEMI|nr:Hypothetical protein NTJ_08598 [Nesidiocoris tenuis]